MLGDVVLVKPQILIKEGLGMGDVPTVVNVVGKYGQKGCKVAKRNTANKGTATNLLTVRGAGILPEQYYLTNKINNHGTTRHCNYKD